MMLREFRGRTTKLFYFTMMKRRALVTGGNKGIGLEICSQLARKGFQVLLTARSREKGLSAASNLTSEGLDVEFHHLDVADVSTIDSLIKIFQERSIKIDVVVNNAGILLAENASILQINEQDLSTTFDTNVFGPLRLLQRLSPFINDNGRIINISSSVAQIVNGLSGYAPLYSMSKVALNALTCELSIAFKNRSIAVNAVTPGWVRTDMGGKSAPLSVAEGADTAVWLATEAPVSLTGKFFEKRKEIPW